MSALKRVANVAGGVMSAAWPASPVSMIAPSTSLLPIHTLTNVGWASRARCSSVWPPNKNSLNASVADGADCGGA